MGTPRMATPIAATTSRAGSSTGSVAQKSMGTTALRAALTAGTAAPAAVTRVTAALRAAATKGAAARVEAAPDPPPAVPARVRRTLRRRRLLPLLHTAVLPRALHPAHPEAAATAPASRTPAEGRGRRTELKATTEG